MNKNHFGSIKNEKRQGNTLIFSYCIWISTVKQIYLEATDKKDILAWEKTPSSHPKL